MVIYTKKRPQPGQTEGKCKARLVAIGCRQTRCDKLQCFSPTVSHAATRMLLVRAASQKRFVGQCDISNAFVRSVLDKNDKNEQVKLLLPKQWSSNPRGDTVLLLRSLYGLRIAPRK